MFLRLHFWIIHLSKCSPIREIHFQTSLVRSSMCKHARRQCLPLWARSCLLFVWRVHYGYVFSISHQTEISPWGLMPNFIRAKKHESSSISSRQTIEDPDHSVWCLELGVAQNFPGRTVLRTVGNRWKHRHVYCTWTSCVNYTQRQENVTWQV